MSKYKFSIILVGILGLRFVGEIFGLLREPALPGMIFGLWYLISIIGIILHRKWGIIMAVVVAIVDFIGPGLWLYQGKEVLLTHVFFDVLIIIDAYSANKELNRIAASPLM